jgi:hypothetical protein
VKGLDEQTLLQLLRVYEAALLELRQINDPSVKSLARRLERRRMEAIVALAQLYMPEEEI